MDAFFVSVELLSRPELVGQEVIVGHPGERSVVLSASYECRAKGVKSAMPMSQAVRLAPRATVIEPTHGLYYKYSARIMEIFYEVTPLVEQLSVDEAFLDVTGSMRRLGPPEAIGEMIRSRLRLGARASGKRRDRDKQIRGKGRIDPCQARRDAGDQARADP